MPVAAAGAIPRKRADAIMRTRSIRTLGSENNARSDRKLAEPSQPPGPTLSESQAARYIGMSRAWLKKSRTRRFVQVADAPPFVRNGKRRIVYRRDDLDEWQRRHLNHVGPAPSTASEL